VTQQRRLDPAPLPVERVIRIARFRAALLDFHRSSDDVARRWGLTPQRYLLLLTIKGAPDGSERLSFSDVAARLRLSRNAVTELVARAGEAGLLVREPAEHDGRVVYLRLSEEGERRLRGAILETDEARRDFRHLFEMLSESFEQHL
jgi:DNA-binding MarR family transcriptional regulator